MAEPFTTEELRTLGLKMTLEESQAKAAKLRLEAVEFERNGQLLAAVAKRREALDLEQSNG